MGKKLECKYIIDIGCGNAQKLVNLYPEFEIIGIDFEDNITQCKNKYDFGTWIENDLEQPNVLNFSQEVLNNSILICADVIEHLVNPSYLLKNLKKLLDFSPLCLISTPERDFFSVGNDFGPSLNPYHVREWNSKEFKNLLHNCDFNVAFMGLTISNTKENKKGHILAGLENNKQKNDSLDFSKWNYPHPEHFSF